MSKTPKTHRYRVPDRESRAKIGLTKILPPQVSPVPRVPTKAVRALEEVDEGRKV